MISLEAAFKPEPKAMLIDDFFLEMYVNAGGLLPDKSFRRIGLGLDTILMLPAKVPATRATQTWTAWFL